ncbi:hypothetical protein J3S89_19800 [Pinisolibacter sp. B13]|uniref:hypothetical protein n=1 Tax=Pinisolibacter aquiterrae TaxID=2815579 RepID=UPI001C3CAF44|nr:hypothetical protein [Pinisolibacter aquiterrae]MBV5266304.1 hypothetical protein [Pinisolibacter aquiterrae]
MQYYTIEKRQRWISFDCTAIRLTSSGELAAPLQDTPPTVSPFGFGRLRLELVACEEGDLSAIGVHTAA